MKRRCPTCKEDTSFTSRGGWLSYANGLGSAESKCPACKNMIPTGRRFWNDLRFSDKMMVYSKMLFWLPVGMAIAFIMIYMYMTTRSDSGMSAAFTRDEAKAFIENDLWFFILMSFVISLAGNMTILKQVIRSNRIRNRNW